MGWLQTVDPVLDKCHLQSQLELASLQREQPEVAPNSGSRDSGR